jgi:hypothetical protein
MGLSPKEFWSLTWYEWGLYVLKLHKERQKELANRELSIERTRQMMALIYNINRGKGPELYPKDFWKLSYDETVTEERPMTLKEVKELLGSTIKKADGK